jgi:hypothetical protein
VTTSQDSQVVSALERHCRLLMRSYPAGYRRERADEIVSTLLDTTPGGRTWPLPRDVAALLLAAVRARAPQERPGVLNSVRLAALLGCAIYLSGVAAAHVSQGNWYGYPIRPLAATVLIWAAALVPFFADRRLVAVIASLAVAANIIDFQVWADPRGAILAVLVPLVLLVLLSGGAVRLPRIWIWLPGLVISATMLAQFLGPAENWYAVAFWMQHPVPIVLIAVAAAWIPVDARPAAGVAAFCGLQFLTNWTYFGSTNSSLPAATAPVETAGPWAGELGPDPATFGQLQWLTIALLLAVLALWRVRRQAVL